MTEASPTTAAPPLGLFSRLIGVIFSPRATFERIVLAPKSLGVILVLGIISGLAQGLPLLTESGKQAAVDAQIQQTERLTGQSVTEEQAAQAAKVMPYRAYGTIIATPLITFVILAVFAGLYFVIFNAVLGGTATFRQLYAVVAHASVIYTLSIVAKVVVEYFQGTVTTMGPFTLGALLPMLDENSFLVRFLGFISVFGIWGTIVTAIGLAVLYRRKTGSVAIGLFILTAVFAAIGATVMGFFSR